MLVAAVAMSRRGALPGEWLQTASPTLRSITEGSRMPYRRRDRPAWTPAAPRTGRLPAGHLLLMPVRGADPLPPVVQVAADRVVAAVAVGDDDRVAGRGHRRREVLAGLAEGGDVLVVARSGAGGLHPEVQAGVLADLPHAGQDHRAARPGDRRAADIHAGRPRDLLLMPGASAGVLVPVVQVAIFVGRGDDDRAARPADHRVGPKAAAVVPERPGRRDLLLMPGPGAGVLVPVVQVAMGVGIGDDRGAARPPD